MGNGVEEMKNNNKIRKLIYEFDMQTYLFYVRAGYFPIKKLNIGKYNKV
jgi:hypothetical protein